MAQSAGDQLAHLFREAATERHRALASGAGLESSPSPPLDAFLIELYVNGIRGLVLGLSADGAVNRFGSGTWSSLGNRHEHAIIDQTDGSFFRQVTEFFQSSWLDQAGVQTLQEQRGVPCVLRLTFICLDRPFSVLELRYGSHSQGPPRDIREFFIRAVEVTQPWYDAQNRRVDRLNKPWWRFW